MRQYPSGVNTGFRGGNMMDDMKKQDPPEGRISTRWGREGVARQSTTGITYVQ